MFSPQTMLRTNLLLFRFNYFMLYVLESHIESLCAIFLTKGSFSDVWPRQTDQELFRAHCSGGRALCIEFLHFSSNFFAVDTLIALVSAPSLSIRCPGGHVEFKFSASANRHIGQDTQLGVILLALFPIEIRNGVLILLSRQSSCCEFSS